MSFTIANGVSLHCVVNGAAARRPLVFINSLGTNLHLWDPLLPHLDPHDRLIRYDKRGHGLSDTPPGPYALGDHTRDLQALLDQLRIEAVSLVGISVGGLIAMDYALRCPGRVHALVLCDTGPRIGTPESWMDRIRGLREQGMAGMAEMILGRWLAPAFGERRPADYHGLRNMLVQTPLEGYIATCAALREADLSAELHQITAPTLALGGTDDGVTPPGVMRQLAAALPNARYEAIQGAAHLPCFEQPEAVAAAINRFFEEVRYGG